MSLTALPVGLHLNLHAQRVAMFCAMYSDLIQWLCKNQSYRCNSTDILYIMRAEVAFYLYQVCFFLFSLSSFLTVFLKTTDWSHSDFSSIHFTIFRHVLIRFFSLNDRRYATVSQSLESDNIVLNTQKVWVCSFFFSSFRLYLITFLRTSKIIVMPT
jgi:hypothetical protein